MKEHDVFLLQGSNKENKKKYLDKSLILMSKKIGKIVKISSYFESEAWNMKNYSIFYNRALHIKTNHSPIDLLNQILNIEFLIGRKRNSCTEHYQDREIDIDILFYDRIIICNFILTIPHPLLHLRRFVLEPLCEIAPNKNHPILNLSILEILGLCMDKLYVKKIL
ncbi:2-amino-4-hydroxy-6-hydroxymethyldihydropteridine pyrophosphokinase [Blattabacterium sp. (Nauphoeta cinerea)]|uniref:2-amino-4-hydroxy-6- hydroxymethyldihydropteridine diphosphokinase n=1 Tax=Blattabacterium sp. (Nauphoeta cinerea) TaxID=1316444 RepID=UPI0003B0644E|nr:2-amino-4-hydroxy-6-hydroxymethyldihydropteridine diphosphokinase [Blattabacterium sp. (Nauphoeta cinerea)]AGW85787.1 2-amino-4-hydroxy-6-hydroxymethyldihydropteridine pyrophosphokinase [Blattabacterium sp. (Nauphoeta cinerea)]